MIDNKIFKCKDLIECLVKNNVEVLIAKYLPSRIISGLREKGIVFLRASTFEEAKEVDFSFLKEKRIKRGVGCSGKFSYK